MTGTRPRTQTTCVTERCTSTRSSALTLCGSSRVHTTTRSASGVAAWTSTTPFAFESSGAGIITGSSATAVATVAGEAFRFPKPGNGWATVDYVP